ncbi:unnamed protein product [Polarella glacialis]|uniref:Uncharacterized protein n=1 Tax=Polarella glacialis TaxID=89957 RepID=A0A813DNI2_POLGL|nr:unnamed protein product [Polarella glacialis]
MRHVKALGPDLLLGCAENFRSAEEIAISARTLSFSPAGLVLTGATSPVFVQLVGAKIANYIMSPISWMPGSASPPSSCSVFGSAEGFASEYRQRWGEDALPQSAEAAAGGIALLAAVQAAGTLESEAVRTALLQLDLETFYAQLAFNADGTRRNASMLTLQVQPLGQDQPKNDRWTKSRIVSVGLDGRLSLWPMPTWEKKEIEVYPCSPGEELITQMDENGASNTCEKCSLGRYRTPLATVCEDCEPGQYGMDIGMSQCHSCPQGANCSDGYMPGGPGAMAGYYLLPYGVLSIAPCEPKELCVGGNACEGANSGILCRQCKRGFALPRFGLKRYECTECPSDRWSLGTILITVLLYVLYIWLIVKGTLSASTSIRAIHSVVLKICMNYLQLAATAFEATDFKVMLLTICGRDKADWLIPLISLPERIQYPMQWFISLDCLVAGTRFHEYQVIIMAGLTLMPLAFFLKTLLAMVRKDCVQKRMTPHLRRWWAGFSAWRNKPASLAADAELGSVDRQGDVQDDGRLPLPLREAVLSPSGQSPRTPEAWTPSRFWGGARSPAPPIHRGRDDLTPMSGFDMPFRRSRTNDDCEVVRWVSRHPQTTVFVSSMATRFVNSSIVMSFILHPVVVRMLVVGFECVELDTLRQRNDLDVNCRSDEHMKWLAWSTVGLVVYGLGTPVLLFLALFRVRKRLLRTEVRKRFGFLYNGFELKYYYFESVYMFRKVVILLFFTAPTMYVRMVLMLFTSWTFILIHVHTQPFDNRSYLCLDRLEALSLGALAATVTARLIFDVREELSGQFFEDLAKHWTVDIAIVVMPLLAHAAFISYAAWSLFRNTVLKHLALKLDVWPERMTCLQRWVLGLDNHKQKATIDEDERGLWIDTPACEAAAPSSRLLRHAAPLLASRCTGRTGRTGGGLSSGN